MGKSQSTQKNRTKIEKEETHAHRKELEAHTVERGRLRCDSDGSQVGSTRFGSTGVLKVNCRINEASQNQLLLHYYCYY